MLQSTLLVQAVATPSVLLHSSPRSLRLFDEVEFAAAIFLVCYRLDLLPGRIRVICFRSFHVLRVTSYLASSDTLDKFGDILANSGPTSPVNERKSPAKEVHVKR